METAVKLSEQRLRDLVEQAFKGAKLSDVERVPGSERLGGVVVWTGFAGQTQIVRQRALSQHLRAQLSPDEWLQVGLLLTVTPEELAAILDD
jgi:hypothetical protein